MKKIVFVPRNTSDPAFDEIGGALGGAIGGLAEFNIHDDEFSNEVLCSVVSGVNLART